MLVDIAVLAASLLFLAGILIGFWASRALVEREAAARGQDHGGDPSPRRSPPGVPMQQTPKTGENRGTLAISPVIAGGYSWDDDLRTGSTMALDPASGGYMTSPPASNGVYWSGSYRDGDEGIGPLTIHPASGRA